MNLYKQTIVIWTEHDASLMDFGALMWDVNHGEAVMIRKNELVEDPESDPDWYGAGHELV